jgi:hypothetical protein
VDGFPGIKHVASKTGAGLTKDAKNTKRGGMEKQQKRFSGFR